MYFGLCKKKHSEQKQNQKTARSRTTDHYRPNGTHCTHTNESYASNAVNTYWKTCKCRDASSTAASQRATEASAARASEERADARISLTLKCSYNCDTVAPCDSPVCVASWRPRVLNTLFASVPQPPSDSATTGTSLIPRARHFSAVSRSFSFFDS